MIINIFINVYYLNVTSLVSYVIWCGALIFSICLGLGLWVNDGLSVSNKIRRAFKMDSKECTTIIKNLLHVANIEKILKIICVFAYVDGILHKNEEKILREFANEQGLNYDKIITAIRSDIKDQDQLKVMNTLKSEIIAYLKTAPNKEIVT